MKTINQQRFDDIVMDPTICIRVERKYHKNPMRCHISVITDYGDIIAVKMISAAGTSILEKEVWQ